MGGLAISQRNAALDHLFGKATWSAPASILVALSTTEPADDGTNITEPADAAYARKATTPETWGTAGGDPSSLANAASIRFDPAEASWGTPTHFALFDDEGTYLGSGALSGTPVEIAAGQAADFAPGELAMKLGDPGDTY